VPFQQLIQMMDLCLDVGLSRITVATPEALSST
jgi:hypothetical protein